jgi:hypothetical protein
MGIKLGMMERHDSIMLGLEKDGFPNCAEIMLVYGPSALEAILAYEMNMDLIAKAEAKGIKVGRKQGSSLLEWSRNLSDIDFGKVAQELEYQHELEPGLFATVFTFTYGCEPFTELEAAKLGKG